MDQDTATGGGFVPTAIEDLLRPDAGAARNVEPAGRQEPEAPAPEASRETGEAIAAPEAKDERPRDASGKFIPKAADAPQEAAGSPPAEQQTQPPQHVPASVLVEERKKWQAKVRELETRLSAPPVPQMPPQPATPPVPLQDLLFQDPERFVATLTQQHEEALMQTRIAASEAVARQQPDYDAAEQALEAYAASSPAARMVVARTLRAHPAPAMWAYQAGKHLLAQQKWAPVVSQHSDPEAYIAAEVERRMAAQRAAAPTPAPSSVPQPPPASLASVRSAGPRNGAGAWKGPTPIASILGRR